MNYLFKEDTGEDVALARLCKTERKKDLTFFYQRDLMGRRALAFSHSNLFWLRRKYKIRKAVEPVPETLFEFVVLDESFIKAHYRFKRADRQVPGLQGAHISYAAREE